MSKLFTVSCYNTIQTAQNLREEIIMYNKVNLRKQERINIEAVLVDYLYNLIIKPEDIRPIQVFDSNSSAIINVLKRGELLNIAERCNQVVDQLILNHDNLIANGKEHVDIVKYVNDVITLRLLSQHVYHSNGNMYINIINRTR